MAAATGSSLYAELRRDHYLRVGTSRYTVATVKRTYWSRTGHRYEYVYVYQAGALAGSDSKTCDLAGCPPLGSRRYVRFAAEAPEVSEITSWDVPDTLQTVPPLGWSELP